jgi:hypothetical protein
MKLVYIWVEAFLISTLNIDEWAIWYLADLPVGKAPQGHFDWEAKWTTEAAYEL